MSRLHVFLGALGALALAGCGGGHHHGDTAHAGHHCSREHGGEASGGCACGRGGHGRGGEHGHHGGEGHHQHGEGHEEHANLPAPVAQFHEVLAPIWHSEPGTGRSERACAAASELQSRGAAIASAPLPEGATEGPWREAVTALNTSIGSLVERCPTNAGGNDALLGEIHTQFHTVMERSGARR